MKLHKDRKFDHMSRDIDAFNGELTLLLSHYKQSETSAHKKEFLAKMGYIVNLLHKNKAPQNSTTHSLLFEYAVESKNFEYANQMLKKLASSTEDDRAFSKIDLQVQEKFY